MHVRLRYVTERRDASGSIRWYWQRRGHPLTRLPDDPVKRFAMAESLNAQADRARATKCDSGKVLVEGSIAWYKESDDYMQLKAGTLKYYNRYLRDIEELGPALPFRSLDRTMVIDFIETYEGVGENRKVAAVLRNLFEVAMYRRIVEVNHAAKLKLSAPASRRRVWEEKEIEAWLKAAEKHPKGEAMAVAFRLLLFLAQRAADMLRMSWSHVEDGAIEVRQQKTGAFLAVPLHAELSRHLTSTKRTATTIVSVGGRPMSYPAFSVAFREITELAGLGGPDRPQPRDLRRTGMVRMAEARATDLQISAVSGHCIETTRQILETYIVRTREMAQGAITKWEEAVEERRRNKGV